MLDKIAEYFNFKELRTNFQTEILAGLTTFFTMSYILILNPKILEVAGMPFEASLTATILAAFVGSIFMGLFAKRPFGVAPYLGENAFIAYTIVLVLGYTWQQALGAILISGILFLILTILNIRPWLVNSIPKSLKLSFTVGLGMFLVFLGLINIGIIEGGTPSSPLRIGNLNSPVAMLGIFGVLLMAVLTAKKVKGAILISIVTVTVLGLFFGETSLPERFFSMPPSPLPVLAKCDVLGILNIKSFPLVFVLAILIFVDTMGTLIGVSYRAGFLDKNGSLPEIHKPMLVDATSTIFASVVGTTTTGVYAESATGVESGGKSGFVAIVVGFMFLVGLFLTPFFAIVPPCAYAPALVLVGILMITTIKEIDFDDWTETFPSILTIMLMAFSSNIGIGMAAGFLIYPILKVLSNKKQETSKAIWVLAFASLLFFFVYPY